MLFFSGPDHTIYDREIRNKHNQLVIHHGEEQELKQETTAMHACYVEVCFKKNHNAGKAVWFTMATVKWSNFCIFVDSIDSHIILRMIRESKREYILYFHLLKFKLLTKHLSALQVSCNEKILNLETWFRTSDWESVH